MAVEVRSIVESEWIEFRRVGAVAFGQEPPSAEWAAVTLRWQDLDHVLAAFDDGAMVGTVRAFAFAMQVPGAALPLSGVAGVGVLPTHRRRGALTALMRRHLDDAHARGEPLAGLYASESEIYGRFGYGNAIPMESWRVARQHAALRGDAPAAGRVRLIDGDEARAVLPAAYARAAAGRAGMIAITDWLWERDTIDRPSQREGFSPSYFAVLERDGQVDGYAIYRVRQDWAGHVARNRLDVLEAIAATDEAYEAIWRYLFGVDLVAEFTSDSRALDDPLPLMLRDPRRLERAVHDGLWLRLVDVVAALAGRAYAAPGDLVIEVRDPFCAWNDGRWHVEGGPDGARCARTDAAPDLTLDVDALAAAYLGGTRVAALAAARRVEEHRAGALARADAMFTNARAPWCRVFF